MKGWRWALPDCRKRHVVLIYQLLHHKDIDEPDIESQSDADCDSNGFVIETRTTGGKGQENPFKWGLRSQQAVRHGLMCFLRVKETRKLRSWLCCPSSWLLSWRLVGARVLASLVQWASELLMSSSATPHFSRIQVCNVRVPAARAKKADNPSKDTLRIPKSLVQTGRLAWAHRSSKSVTLHNSEIVDLRVLSIWESKTQ